MKKIFIGLMFILPEVPSYSQQQIINLKANQIESIAILPHFSNVKVRNSTNIDSTRFYEILASQQVSKSSEVIVDEMMKMIDLKNQKILLDSLEQINYNMEVVRFMAEIKSHNLRSGNNLYKLEKICNNLYISNEMAKIIKNKNETYGLFVINQGMTNTNPNKTKRILSDVGTITLNLLLGGIGDIGLFPNDFRNVISSFIFIVNSETKKVENFFINTTDSDPLNVDLLRNKQILPCFEKYWVWYYSEGQIYKKLKLKKKK
jgi:hypothetical protein